MLAALAAFPRLAAAQNADAETLFSEADRLESRGQLAEACDAFEASNRIEARAGTMIRIGQCRERQGRLASAWSAFKDALTRAKDPAKRKLAEAAVASLEPRLSYLTVLVPDANRVDGLVLMRNGSPLDPALWNRAAPVDGGVYTIGGKAPGHEVWTATVEVAVESDRASVEVPRFKELRALVEPDGGTGGGVLDTGDDDEGGEDGRASSRWTGRRKVALGLAAGALIGAGGGVALGVQANGLEADARRLCPSGPSCGRGDEANALVASATTRATLANVSFGVAAAAALGATVLWFTGAPEHGASRLSVAPRLDRGSPGLDLLVRF